MPYIIFLCLKLNLNKQQYWILLGTTMSNNHTQDHPPKFIIVPKPATNWTGSLQVPKDLISIFYNLQVPKDKIYLVIE